jgi:hypothetical protein
VSAGRRFKMRLRRRKPLGYLERDGDDLPEELQGDDLPAEQRQLRVAVREGLTMTPTQPFAVEYEGRTVALRPHKDYLAPEHQIVRENPLLFDAVAPRFSSRRSAETRAYAISDGRVRLLHEAKIEER